TDDTAGDEIFSAQFFIMATGCLSAANTPDFEGLDSFTGRTFHTGRWPHEKVDFKGRRVGVIGTGSSGVQIIPEIAKQAEHLTVFQRTATYVVEAFNRPLGHAERTDNRDNVSLVSLGEGGVKRITPTCLVAKTAEFQIDDLVLATGFDAMTGAISRVHIQGRDNLALRTAWEAGPRTYLGLMTHGFPNFFIITGPGSPSVLTNMVPTIEQHVEWIAECIDYLREQDLKEIEADLNAQNEWVEQGNELATKTLRYSCSSWYLGANVPGKPRVFMPYIGGMPAYREKCAAVAAAEYEGFRTGEPHAR
ncbi:MAG: NAD(P)/FAD-dependent oxidoreductase, partial [Proteobacteria bacterium]|nr:NAD(P)/FAD-dependent oxidoreductase [Pseudomonadota bacterium]